MPVYFGGRRAGAAAASYGDKITTADASYHYLRPALNVDYSYAEARVIKRVTQAYYCGSERYV